MSQPPDAPDPYLPPQPGQQQEYVQQGYQQQTYTGPGGPARPSQQAVDVDKPPSMVRLVQVMLAGAVLAVLSGVYGLVVFDSAMAEALPQMQEDPSLGGIDTGALAGLTRTVAFISVFVGSVVGAGLWVLFAWLLGRGQGRVLGSVLGAVNGVGTLGSLFFTIDLLELLLQLLTLAVVVGAMVLLWLPATSAWFRAVKAADRSIRWT